MKTRIERPGSSSLILPLALLSMSAMASASHANECLDIRSECQQPEQRDHLIKLCEAAKSGNAGAMYWLGLAYIEGVVLKDYDKGVEWLKKASFAGNQDASRLYEYIDSAQIGPGC